MHLVHNVEKRCKLSAKSYNPLVSPFDYAQGNPVECVCAKQIYKNKAKVWRIIENWSLRYESKDKEKAP
jgi:hypothetical protein